MSKFTLEPLVFLKGHTIDVKLNPWDTPREDVSTHHSKDGNVNICRTLRTNRHGVHVSVTKTCGDCGTVHVFNTESTPKAKIEPPDSECPHIERCPPDYY
jgi:hypothetical protein